MVKDGNDEYNNLGRRRGAWQDSTMYVHNGSGRQHYNDDVDAQFVGMITLAKDQDHHRSTAAPPFIIPHPLSMRGIWAVCVKTGAGGYSEQREVSTWTGPVISYYFGSHNTLLC